MKRFELGIGVWLWVSEQEWAQHTTLGSLVFCVVFLEELLLTHSACGLPVRKSSSQLHMTVEPQVDQYVYELL